MAKNRKNLSKRTRFEVFKRDDFQCRYCGSRAPEIVLHVDHIVAVANGGTDALENLIAACESCNAGKAARELGEKAPPIPVSAAETMVDRAEQIEAYREAMAEWIEQRNAMRVEVAVAVYEAIWGHEDPGKMLADEHAMNAMGFVEKLGFKKVLELATVTGRQTRKFYSFHKAWRYFCGCCWHEIRRSGDDPSNWDGGDNTNPGSF